jgi:hypothetical protein
LLGRQLGETRLNLDAWRPPGQPKVLSEDAVKRILNHRPAGETLQAIADDLMAGAVATAPRGALWRPSSVAAVLRSHASTAAASLWHP